jgi:long-chain fatty acid transport protein
MRDRFLLRGFAAGMSLAFITVPALADQFHYSNVLVGTRAVGMGGAFGGIADDASGIYYNPGGLAFALSNDIQGSANAFYGKNTVYKKALGDTDFTEQSSGSLTPFFGGLQKLDRYVDGLVAAFGVYYTDGDLKDQDTPIDSFQVGNTTIDRYHRTSNARASTYFAGAGVGYRVLNNLGIGFGLSYFNADELLQEFQYAKQEVMLPLTDGTSVEGWRILASNLRQHLAVYGVQPTLGIQVALPAGFTAGLTVKKTIVATQSLETQGDTVVTKATDAQNKAAVTSGSSSTISNPIQSTVTKQDSKSTNPVGDLPLEARLGMAWFASSTMVWSLDISYYDAVTNADVSTDPNKVRAAYAKEAVTNYATGMEWYMTPSLPLRFGLFTNNDARPKVKKGTSNVAAGQTCTQSLDYYKKYCAQPDHIDYYGGSLFIAWVQPNSQISAGITVQTGTGKAQKLGDDLVQSVSSRQYSFAFSATHNM